jgi:hypothetical protein
MILHPTPGTNGSRAPARIFLAAALAVSSCALAACDSEDPSGTGEALCGGEPGVGLRVEGRAEPLEVCVSDQAVDALLTAENRFDVSAVMVTDGGNYQLRMVFARRNDYPVTLRIVTSITEVVYDPGAAYVYYEELPDGGTPVESEVILGGRFRLAYSDGSSASGTLEKVTMEMSNVLNGDPAGQRKITEGYFSITTELPAASVIDVR